MLQLVVTLKAITEVAGLALLGQGLLYVLAGTKRETNFAYLVLRTVTSPVFALIRMVLPAALAERYGWLIAPAIVFTLWMLLTVLKIYLVVQAAA